MNKLTIKQRIKKDKEEVKKFPLWQRQYIISAEAFKTGKLIDTNIKD